MEEAESLQDGHVPNDSSDEEIEIVGDCKYSNCRLFVGKILFFRQEYEICLAVHFLYKRI